MSPQIASLDHAQTTHSAGVVPARRVPPQAVAPAQAQDRSDHVELSAEALEAAGGGIRQELVDSIKALIASGQYDTDDKVDAATDRLLRDLYA